VKTFYFISIGEDGRDCSVGIGISNIRIYFYSIDALEGCLDKTDRLPSFSVVSELVELIKANSVSPLVSKTV
jgi:hypothetical protein